MEDWFEIFKVGTHTDSAGNTSDWTIEDLDKIILLYDPANHEAPIVIGHPEHDSPAYGWIGALKREGDRLLAKPKQLVEDFKDWVRQGLYKKVSMALYPDFRLRHVGFLGAVPPAVKGLATVQFAERGRLQFYDSELKGGIEMSDSKTIDGTKIVPKDFDTAVQKVMKEKKASKAKAIEFCAREYPELHQEYVANLSAEAEEESRRRFEENLAVGNRIVFLVNEKRKANKDLSYSEALSLVQKEDHELILEYIRGK